MKKNKLLYVFLIPFVILPLLVGCGNKNEIINLKSSASTTQTTVPKDEENDKEKSVIIATSEWPPYEFEENRKIKGIGVDIVSEVFKRMGYKVTIKYVPFSRGLEMLKNGEADLATDVKNTAARQEYGIFSKEPILTTHTCLFVKSDSKIKFSGNILELKNYKFGIIRDYSYGEDFDNAVKNKSIQVEEVDDTLENINKILDDRLDICVEDRLVELTTLKAAKVENKLKELKPELNETPVYALFSKKKNTGKIIEEFDRKIVEIKQDGTFEKIYNLYVN